MLKSRLEANTYGIGALITQRKLFCVPEHQRNFAWTTEEVERYLEDVQQAVERSEEEYFIGLVVLMGPLDNVWQVLDGQQRLATTTMIYAAIREWLLAREFKEDADQIESEFMGVRQLGGKYTPRLRLNSENRQIFEEFVIKPVSNSEIQKELKTWPKRSSNHDLLEASSFCREWIARFASCNANSKEEQATRLFRLSSYLETRVKVVCLDVSSEANAYILFEALNDRGADLSALDLVKNYIFSKAGVQNIELFRSKWSVMTQNIEGKDADDFLKVFWTSRFGIIQKLELFNRLRREYENEPGARQLVVDLADASEKCSAIEDPEHELWSQYGKDCRRLIADLSLLGSRQVRPLILAAMNRFDKKEIASFLWALTVVIVRYQVIGKGRTGVLEKQFGWLARQIHLGQIKNSFDSLSSLTKLLTDDETFHRDFCQHLEYKASRLIYFLLELELTERGVFAPGENLERVRELKGVVSPIHIFDVVDDTEDSEKTSHSLGNVVLLEDTYQDSLLFENFDAKLKVCSRSELELTRNVEFYCKNGPPSVRHRAEYLADLAVDTWKFGNLLYGQISPTI
ncbi:DUF262 domain-containing protein [Pedosphaera parvula]|uniref:GmrSD restriction endonucleases N-terminal domain-containing protein n=1 Tax=Pedosphaera parvula (strain Ellin514) TaxID=320771 RepID=B9XJV1_PEDPL|nr:DUF262 domain-containing protein [Pedosphaera parvula]EEF59977.1 protein of unknown function DUF262 [Pedosphaera parvula Ellin514]